MSKMNYSDRLKRDLLLYGNCYEITFKPNWFQRIYRRLLRLPVDRKRIDPMKINIGNIPSIEDVKNAAIRQIEENGFKVLSKKYIESMAKKLDKDILS